MKVNIYRKEEDKRFYITFDDVTIDGQGFESSLSLNVEDFKTLGEKINTELENLNNNLKEEIVWNPKSQRHEIIKR